MAGRAFHREAKPRVLGHKGAHALGIAEQVARVAADQPHVTRRE